MTVAASGIRPLIIAGLINGLREELAGLRRVSLDLSKLAGEPGQVINVPVPAALPGGTVTPAATPPALGTVTNPVKPITLGPIYASRFDLSSLDKYEIADVGDYVAKQTKEAVRTVLVYANSLVLGRYIDFPQFFGTAGTPPYAADISATQQARFRLNNGLAPMGPRSFLLNAAAELNASQRTEFLNNQYRQNIETASESGLLGRLLGLDHVLDSQIPTATAGTAAAATVTVGTGGFTFPALREASDYTIPLQNAASTSTLVIGDLILITVSGRRLELVVTAPITLTTSPQSVSVRSVGNGNAVVVTATTSAVVQATSVRNMFFHRDAIGLAIRPARVFDGELAEIITDGGDGGTGISMKLLKIGGYHASQYEVSIVAGANTLRPEWGGAGLG